MADYKYIGIIIRLNNHGMSRNNFSLKVKIMLKIFKKIYIKNQCILIKWKKL